MSTTTMSQMIPPVKGDIVLTSKGHRRLWDGRHWRVLCRIPECIAQRQGSLDNKFGLCKKHFTQIEFLKFQSIAYILSESLFLPLNVEQDEEKQIASLEEQEEKKTCKRHRRNLNVIVDQLRRSQTISTPCSVEG